MSTATRQIVQPRPCAKCPFRAKFQGADDFLRPGRRRGIVTGLLQDDDFPCHETTVPQEDDEGWTDMVPGPDTVSCAGAALVMYRAGSDMVSLRIAERLGMLDIGAFVAANEGTELWTMRQCLDELDDEDEEIITCTMVGPNCLAPAGYLIGGEAVHGTEPADGECVSCGEGLCSECADDDGHCDMCASELAEYD